MGIEKLNIENFLELSKQHVVIDVRSPAEYAHAHIPGAYSLPLFSDEERKIVGTAYKQQSREAAIKIGLDFFGPKMRKMVEEVEELIGNSQSAIDNGANSNRRDHLPIANGLLIYCWRGGMRSAGVAWLLDLYGFKVFSLIGGYKKFRNHVLEMFKLPFQFKILGGYTGSGKTEMLNTLKDQGELIIDLEEIARHKGSAFGKIGCEQPSQEMFENILAQELRHKWSIGPDSDREQLAENDREYSPLTIDHSPIWLEDESQRIGDINIPHDLWKTIRQAPVYFFDIPFEKRLQRIVEEYGNMDREKLVDSITRIERRLGSLETKNAINYLHENNTVECFRILLKYYDKWYLKSLHNRNNLNSLLVSISCENVGLDNTGALRQQASIS
ncbi:MAG: tRNA 2-selenouridine(34) synthase MnmH [Bacteroidetes bacterium]|nr:MAG: tRNA 2-selenouridine(34) synthase MnmH [Bacteroidota bacterium]